jgi:hypothetical protein
MALDPELLAMSQVFDILKNLEQGQRQRIIRWVDDRLNSSPAEPSSVSQVTPAQTHFVQSVTEEPKVVVKPPERKDIGHYDTALDLFAESSVKKATAKVLLMAAYLQERHNYKEMGSYDINFRLKRIGHGVTNISSLINSLLNRTPHLLVQVGANGEQKKHSRRKFSVTVEGLKVARSYLKD